MRTHTSGAPVSLDDALTVTSRGRVAMAVGSVVLATVALSALSVGPVAWPMLPRLVSVQYVAMAAVCAFTALLLFSYAKSSGRRGYVVLAGTYLYIAGINLAAPLFQGGGGLLSESQGPLLGGEQSPVYLYSLWHWAFAFGVITSAAILEWDTARSRPHALWRWSSAVTVGVVLLALIASVILVASAGDWGPTMFVGDTLTPTARNLSLARLALTLAGTAYVALLVVRRGSLINRWLLAVMLVMLAESVVVLRPQRNMFTYYANLALALAAMSVLLVALTWTLARVGRVQADLAAMDSATGVRTRTSLLAELTRELDRAARRGGAVALLWIDLDGFQEVNDELGHGAGDEVLRHVAARIQRQVRPGDVVGRLGGDEFGVVLTGVTGPDGELADTVADRILAGIREPMLVADTSAMVTASIGIALAETDGVDASELMLRADVAMYAAKMAGGDCHERFSEAMGDRAVQQATLRHDLNGAIRGGDFALDYQPVIDARDRHTAGAEVLVRWIRGGERLAAGSFIEFAERTGQIVGIGRLVVDMVGEDVAAVLAAGGPDFFVTVNLSVRELATEDLVDRILTGPLAPVSSAIVIEVTETFDLHADPRAVANLARLRRAGFATAIDDFGTGYSNLRELTRLYPRFLKADRSLVEAATAGTKEGVGLLAAAKAIADSLGCEVIAEGIETKVDEAIVSALGLQYLQGYLFARPMPLNELLARLGSSSQAVEDIERRDPSMIAYARFTREGRLVWGNPRFLGVTGAGHGAVLTDLVVEGQRDHVQGILDGGEIPIGRRHLHFVQGEGVPVSMVATWAWEDDELVLVAEAPIEDDLALRASLMRLNSHVAELARDNAKRSAELERALSLFTLGRTDAEEPYLEDVVPDA